MNLKDTYNRIARDWMEDHLHDNWWTGGTDTFLSFLPQNASVLDVGCAGGLKTNYIASKGFHAEGVDFSEKMIEIARQKFPHLSFEVADLFDLSVVPQTFDGVTAQAVLLHVPKADIPKALASLKSKLVPGGVLYVSVKQIRENQRVEEMKTESDYGYEYTRFFSYFTLEEITGLIQDAGFEVLWKEATASGRAVWLQVVARSIVEV